MPFCHQSLQSCDLKWKCAVFLGHPCIHDNQQKVFLSQSRCLVRVWKFAIQTGRSFSQYYPSATSFHASSFLAASLHAFVVQLVHWYKICRLLTLSSNFSTYVQQIINPSIHIIYQSISRLWINYEYLCDKSAISLVKTHLCHPLSFVVVQRTPDDVVRHRVRQRSSYQLLEGRHWVTERFLSLPPGRGTLCDQQSLLRQPCIYSIEP